MSEKIYDVPAEWARKAYLDDVKDPVVEMDVNLFGGVSTRNLEDTIDWWQLVLADFKLNVLEE